MVVVTHEMGFAREVANHLIFLHKGLIEEQGVPTDVLNRPTSERLAQFLSGSLKQPHAGVRPRASAVTEASVRDGERLRTPAAAQRLGEIDDRQPRLARGADAQRLRREQRALRVEHLEERVRPAS